MYTQFDIYFIPVEYFLLQHMYPFRAVAKINQKSFNKQNITMQRNRDLYKDHAIIHLYTMSLYVYKMYFMNCICNIVK